MILPEPCPSSAEPKPRWDENERLAALERYSILDSGREAAFDDIAELAAEILQAPIAVVNFIAADRQWFKAEKGIGTDSLPLDVSICRHAIMQPGVLVVPDLRLDARFEANPLVEAVDGLRFYAGALLETPEGLPLGTVCVLDTRPRPDGVSEGQERALAALAAQTMAQLQLRLSNAAIRQESSRFSAMFAQASVGMSEIGLDGRFLEVNDTLCELLGRSRSELLSHSIFEVTHPDDVAVNKVALQRLTEDGERFSLEKRYLHSSGRIVWANSSVTLLLDDQQRPRAALAVTTDTTRQREEERSRSFLLRLTDRTRNSADPHEVVTTTVGALGEELGASRVAYVEIDESRRMAFRSISWTDGILDPLPAEMQLSDFEGPILDCLRTGSTMRVCDTVADPRTGPTAHVLVPMGACAIVSVPLIKEGRLLGNFNVHQSRPREWTDAEVELIEAVAERTWEAVERAQAEIALRSSAKALAAEVKALGRLQAISTRLVSDEAPQVLYDAILSAAVDLMGSDCASIQMLNAAGDLELLACRGYDPRSAEYWQTVSRNHGSTCGLALEHGERVIVPDVEESGLDPESGDLQSYRWTGMRAVQTTPLLSRSGKPIGMISTHWKRPHHPSERDLKLFDVLARQAADAIERVATQAELRESEGRQAFLLSLSDTLRLLKSPQEIAAAAAERLGERFALSRVFYAEISGSLMRVEVDFTRGVPSIAGEHDLAAFGPDLLRAYHECPVVKVEDVQSDERFSAQAKAGLQARQVGAYLDVVLFEDDQ